MDIVIIAVVFLPAALFLFYLRSRDSNQPLSRFGSRCRAISKYIVGVFIGTFGAAGCAVAIAAPLLVYGRLSHSDTALDIFSQLLDRPYFPLQSAVALVLGYFTAIWLAEGKPALVWVLPLLKTGVGLAFFSHPSVMQGTWAWTKENLFNLNCGCSATLMQWEFTFPLFASLGFTAGVLLRFATKKRTDNLHSHLPQPVDTI